MHSASAVAHQSARGLSPPRGQRKMNLAAKRGRPRLDPARAPHGMALLDEHGRAVGYDALGHELAHERTSGAARRRVFPDAHGGVEEPSVRHRVGVHRIEAVQVAALASHGLQGCREARRVRPRAIDDFANSRAAARMAGSLMCSASTTRASGLPVSGASAKTSTR